MDIALMVEGQDGLNWDRWIAIAKTAEEVGFAGLYRSDHFTNPVGPFKDSLECWVSLAYLATNTSRLEFGPMVSPISFRHPAMLVRQAAAIADLSGGRLQVGLLAGWIANTPTRAITWAACPSAWRASARRRRSWRTCCTATCRSVSGASTTR